jgi:hypothetical protein
MVYLPILKPMRLVSEEEAVGRNAKELAEDHNHARKHSGRDGANPPTLTPKKAILCFCGGEPPIRKAAARLETRSLSPGRYIGKYTFEVNAEA